MFDLICQWLYFHKLVGVTGVEPARLAPTDPKSVVSANSTTRPCWSLLSTLDRGSDGDCLLDSDFAFVTSHTFLTSVCGHFTRGVLLSEKVLVCPSQKEEFGWPCWQSGTLGF